MLTEADVTKTCIVNPCMSMTTWGWVWGAEAGSILRTCDDDNITLEGSQVLIFENKFSHIS
jgi:hypothetical protein